MKKKALTAYIQYQKELNRKRIIANGLIALAVSSWFVGLVYLAYKAV